MNKAVLVSISTYGTAKPDPLPGAASALSKWKALLVDHYGFTSDAGGNLHILQNSAATKANMTSEMAWLSNGTTAGDLLVVIFMGHGSQRRRTDPNYGVVHNEQCLLMYPAIGQKLKDAALFGDELLNMIGNITGPVLIIIDACHAEGVLQGKLKSLYHAIEGVERKTSRGERVMTFIDRLDDADGPKADRERSILALTAARALEAAYEDEIGGSRELLFSYYATDALTLDDTKSYQRLRDVVLALLERAQKPSLFGDDLRKPKSFITEK